MAPLYQLLQKDTEWTWGSSQVEAFTAAKAQLTSSNLLVHYSSERDLVLSCDASPYGVGAVLSHRMEDGEEKPVAFASRSLSAVEKRYSQLDKEALAIVFGVTKFRQYLLGRHFYVVSDHKPLLYLFGESRAVPPLASARLQRWALTLSAYSYSIMHKPGKDHANADVLSRLPLPDAPAEVPVPGDTVLLMEHLQASPITAAQIKRWTERDPVLSKVQEFVMTGWPSDEASEELRPFRSRKLELSVENGCLLWGRRVVVPPQGREKVIEELHAGHPGASRMTHLARSFVWWPGMDANLEAKVRSCIPCQSNAKSPALAPLHPWEWPQRPWCRVHADYAGPFMGRMFLVIIDAHSKWLEVHMVNAATTLATVEKMRSTFAAHGLPEILVTDNGSQFTSSNFEEFLTKNGIRHIRSSPYHPASNGLAERAVQILKNGLRKVTQGTLESRLSRVLFKYRITPHTTTGKSPAELLMGRPLRSHLDQLRPDSSLKVRQSQERQKASHDTHAKHRSFQVGETVFVREFVGNKSSWSAGVVTEIRGPLSYRVQLDDGRIWQRHVDHVRARDSGMANQEPSIQPLPASMGDWEGPMLRDPEVEQTSTAPEPEVVLPAMPRRSSRVSRPPDRYS